MLGKFWKKGQDFLGVNYPILCGAMTWVSESSLVAAVSNLGAFGCLAGGNMSPDLLAEEIDNTRKLTDKPFGVNVITIAPKYEQHLEVIKAKKPPFVIFAGSFPHAYEIKAVKESGAKVICFASNDSIAVRMINNGADALILEGSEAGGHIGHVSLMILIQQVLFQINSVPIFVAGGIATGKMMAHLLLMGASGVQMGTKFVLSQECKAHPKFKESFVKARARDAVSTPQIGSELHVVAVRALKNKGMNEFANLQIELIQKIRLGEMSQKESQFKVEEFWMGALRTAAVEGDVVRGSVMAGQSVGLVDKIQPLKEIIDELINDAEDELKRIRVIVQPCVSSQL
ncbi:MAG: nitronate monooxygenase [bacterium]